MKPKCRWCVAQRIHPWHDDGTPSWSGLQPIIDEYDNFSDSSGDGNE